MATTQLEPRVAPGRELRSIDLGIYSAMPEGFDGAPFDSRAFAIDAITGSPMYQRLAWGVSADTIEAFANEAFDKENLPYLDAGCGTMRFTAPVYARVEHPLTAVDLSLGALRRAQGKVSLQKIDAVNRIAFVQADLVDLPFSDASYETVFCSDVLHEYADAGRLLDSLVRIVRPGGEFYVTSLVSSDRAIGEKYAGVLQGKGLLSAWRTPDEVKSLIGSRLDLVSFWTEGNMAFAWAVKRL